MSTKKSVRYTRNNLKKLGSMLGAMLVVLISTISVLLSQAIVWMFHTWKNLTMDELVYQLNAPVEGTNSDIILDFIYTCIPGTALVFMLVIILLLGLRKKKKSYRISCVFVLVVSITCLGGFVNMMWNRLDISNYKENKNTYSSFIDDNYVDARNVEITFPEEKRNLIYIYLESMEITYTNIEDGGAFENGCIPELTQIAQKNEDFSGSTTALNGGYSLPGTTWTMGGLFAQTSGLPLSIPIDGNSMDTQASFFPGITVLGDILQEAGYNQTFFIGSEGTFGGRELYFTEHGNYEVKDYAYAVEKERIPEDYYVWWGYEDKYLFDAAKEELLVLAEQNQPFNFTMLTVDTHFEDGYRCSDCGDTYGDDSYANVMACSSKKVQEFVEWVQQQEFYENTTIVITGDHPTMDSDFCDVVSEDYVRKTYTAYINSAVSVENEEMIRDYSTMDQYPTTLASLGVIIEGNRLGLGTNLFSSELTLIEKYGRDTVINEIQKESELMDEMTSTIDTENETVLLREGKLATADIVTSDYDSQTESILVTISNFEKIDDLVEVKVAVWTMENQRDLIWSQAVLQEDGSYVHQINVSDFGFATDEYIIHVYGVTSDNSQAFLGQVIKEIE